MITALAITRQGEVLPIYDWSAEPVEVKMDVVELVTIASTEEEFNGFKLKGDPDVMTWDNYYYTVSQSLRLQDPARARNCSMEYRLGKMQGIKDSTKGE
jgi:hypothetical protein